MEKLYWYKAYVTKVYDGDTITVDIELGFSLKMSNIKIRLAGIDTPEVRGEEREQGLISRDWLSDKILNKWISLNTIKDSKGKYGRYLGYIYYEGENLNEALINEGLAEKYGK
jgi:micrococcal nuclease